MLTDRRSLNNSRTMGDVAIGAMNFSPACRNAAASQLRTSQQNLRRAG